MNSTRTRFTDPLDYSNRGSQHLWFTSPFGSAHATRWHLFATHPTLDDRIERLAELYPVLAHETVALQPASTSAT
ncbi:MAG: hypothetical protein ABI725_06705 [Chloroflexota bacterium]